MAYIFAGSVDRGTGVPPVRWSLEILPRGVTSGLCPHFVVHFVAQGLEARNYRADPAEDFPASTGLCLGHQCPLYTQILQFFVSEHWT